MSEHLPPDQCSNSILFCTVYSLYQLSSPNITINFVHDQATQFSEFDTSGRFDAYIYFNNCTPAVECKQLASVNAIWYPLVMSQYLLSAGSNVEITAGEEVASISFIIGTRSVDTIRTVVDPEINPLPTIWSKSHMNTLVASAPGCRS